MIPGFRGTPVPLAVGLVLALQLEWRGGWPGSSPGCACRAAGSPLRYILELPLACGCRVCRCSVSGQQRNRESIEMGNACDVQLAHVGAAQGSVASCESLVALRDSESKLQPHRSVGLASGEWGCRLYRHPAVGHGVSMLRALLWRPRCLEIEAALGAPHLEKLVW